MRRPTPAGRAIRGTVLGMTLTLFMAALASPSDRQGGAVAPPRPLIPVAASTLAANPDAYYGESVTLTAAVEQILGRTAFSVDQDNTRSTGNDVLILAPRLNADVGLNTYVTVIGEVVRFEPAEIADRLNSYAPDLAGDVVAKYRGRPAVMATAVINAAMVDLARRLPPPMAADEEAFSKVMKRVGPAFAALRDGIAGSKADVAKENADVLRQAFTEAEAFWKARRKADAAQWARDARKEVEALDRAAGGGSWDEAKAAASSLGQACQTCHAAYRERFDDGTYRIKTGTD